MPAGAGQSSAKVEHASSPSRPLLTAFAARERLHSSLGRPPAARALPGRCGGAQWSRVLETLASPCLARGCARDRRCGTGRLRRRRRRGREPKGGGSINVAIVDTPQHAGPRASHAVAVHQPDQDQGELHDPRRGHLARGDDTRRGRRRPPVRRGDDRPVRGAAVRRGTATSGTSRAWPPQTGLRPGGRHPVGTERPVVPGQALCVAVLRRVVLPDVPQGRAPRRRDRRCRPIPPGDRSRRSPGGSTRPRWPASACAASRDGASSVPRSPPC